jgi:hypothetical protein
MVDPFTDLTLHNAHNMASKHCNYFSFNRNILCQNEDINIKLNVFQKIQNNKKNSFVLFPLF